MNDHEPEHAALEQDHMLSNAIYNFLKFLAQILLPALGTLYFGLAKIWNFPAGEEVVGTLTVIDTFLGIILSASSKSYNSSNAKFDGTINVLTPDDGPQKVVFNMSTDPEDYDQKKIIQFRVNTPYKGQNPPQ